MSITYINTGTSPNKGDGDSLRSAFIKINQSFSYIDGVLSTSTVDGSNITILDQSIYGTVPNRDIELLPSGTGSVVVPSLTTPSLTISETNTATTAYVGFVYYEQARASNLTPGNYLSTGTFGIPYAVPAPYFVFSATGDNLTINKITAGDFCSGADSKTYPVLARGTGIYQNYIVLDVTEYQLGEEQSNIGTEIHVTRNLNRNFTQFISNTGSGIILDCDNTELQVHGSIIPFEESPDQSLGMPTRRWSDIWLGTGGINIEDEANNRDIKISANNGNLKLGQTGISVGSLIIHNDYISATTSTRFFVGTDTDILSIDLNGISLTLPGSSIIFSDGTMQTTAYTGGSGSTGDITFSGVKVIGAGTASGDGLGYSTLELVPDANLTSTNQYLIIDPTSPSHIHIRAGGTIDQSGADLFLGGEKNYVRVNDFSGIRLQNETQNENFYYYDSSTSFTAGSWYEENGSFYLEFTTTDQTMINWFWEFSNNPQNRIVINQNDTLQYGGWASSQGNNVYKIQVTTGPVSSPEVVNTIEFQIFTVNTNSLTLENNDFRVDVLDDIRMFGRDIFRLVNYSVDEPIEITTDYNSNSYTWSFNPDGTLRFPDNSIQTTAFTGTTLTDTLSSVVARGATTTNAITVGNLITSNVTGKYSTGTGTILSGIRPPDGAGANLGYVWVPDVAALSSLGDITGWTMANSDGIFSTTIVQMRYDLGAAWAIQTADPLIFTGTYTFTSPDYAPPVPNPMNVTVGVNTWTFNNSGNIVFPDATVQETAYTGPQTSLVGVIDNNVLVRTSETVITNNLYTNITDFVTDIDPGLGFVINGWSQRNETEIELNLFAPSLGSFYTFLTGLALGRTVVVTYSTVSGNQTFTSTVSQIFSAIAQFDPVTGWQRISGRILGTLPVDQTGIVSVNFPVTTTPQHDWIFGSNGDTIFPFGSDVIFDSSSTSYVYGLSDIEFADGSKPLRRVDTIPASSTSTGSINQVAFTGTDMYVCIAPDSWVKFTGTTF